VTADVIPAPDLGTKVAAFKCSELMLPPTAFARVAISEVEARGEVPAGLKTGAETDADIREGDVIGDESATEPAVLKDVGMVRPDEPGLKGCADTDGPKAAFANGPLDRLIRPINARVRSAFAANNSIVLSLTRWKSWRCR
jgi:hypothetical protein